MIIVAYKKENKMWYLPQLNIIEHKSNLFSDAYDFYHNRLSKMKLQKPTKVPYLWIINGDIS